LGVFVSRNAGSFAKSELGVGTGLVGAPACGDVMKLQIKVNDQGIISDVRCKFDAFPFIPPLFPLI
jgi:NifU-like protein involved in Fe-S cluster formation